jgi:hypothetical protein
LDRAENCAQLAEEATSTPAKNRYKRMEAGWRALAAEQQWLDGELAPTSLQHNEIANSLRSERRMLSTLP